MWRHNLLWGTWYMFGKSFVVMEQGVYSWAQGNWIGASMIGAACRDGDGRLEVYSQMDGWGHQIFRGISETSSSLLDTWVGWAHWESFWNCMKIMKSATVRAMTVYFEIQMYLLCWCCSKTLCKRHWCLHWATTLLPCMWHTVFSWWWCRDMNAQKSLDLGISTVHCSCACSTIIKRLTMEDIGSREEVHRR